MPPIEHVHALHDYYLRASCIREDLKKVKEDKSLPHIVLLIESMSRLSVFYGLLFAVIEGFNDLAIRDAEIDALLADDAKVSILRRYRNAIFHYQNDFYESPKVLEMLNGDEMVPWTRALWKALSGWFEKNVVVPTLMPNESVEGGAKLKDRIDEMMALLRNL